MDLGAITGDWTIQLLESKHFMATDTHAFQLCDFTLELTDDAFKILLIPHLDVIWVPNFHLLPGCSQPCCFHDVAWVQCQADQPRATAGSHTGAAEGESLLGSLILFIMNKHAALWGKEKSKVHKPRESLNRRTLQGSSSSAELSVYRNGRIYLTQL